MPKEEWGTKRLCPQCATRFYDLNNDPMTCPACAASFTAESLVANSRGRGVIADKAAVRGQDQDDVLDADDDLDADGTDGDLDDDLLEDDDDDSVSLDDIADVADGDDEN